MSLSQSGILPSSEVIEAFNSLKLGRTGVKYIIFKIQDKEIIVDETSKEQDFEKFRKRMCEDEEEGKPKYAVYDVEYELSGGEGKRSKLCLIRYIPDNAEVSKDKLVYSTTYNGLKNALTGVPREMQCSDKSELTWDDLLKKVM